MKTLVEAVNDGLHTEMERDASVMVMGEDVGTLGGVFRATAGLRERFGSDRCVDRLIGEMRRHNHRLGCDHNSAFSLLYSVPVVVMYLFVQRRYGFRFYGGIKS